MVLAHVMVLAFGMNLPHVMVLAHVMMLPRVMALALVLMLPQCYDVSPCHDVTLYYGVNLS